MQVQQQEHRAGYIAVIGRPNAGKSTLIDKLIGEKAAIVSDRPQTTRNRILCILSTEKAQLIFLDTPGLHKPKDKLGEHMVKAAEDSLKDVDAVLYVVDATEKRGKGEAYILERLKKVQVPVILVLNKVDLINQKENLLPRIDAFQKAYPFHGIMTLSALEDRDQTERVMVSEIIREKILRLTHDEVPHAVAVKVNEMKTRDNGMVYVRADIYVERDSQKGILIGRKGQMLKQISAEARKDIEDLVGSQVYLEIWVKVRPKWREKETELRQLGLSSDHRAY